MLLPPLTMFVLLKDLLMRLPIVRLLKHSHDEKCLSDCEKEALHRQYEENRRRVQVLEWMTLPHTQRRSEPHDTH